MVQWSEKYNIDVPSVDDQHKEIVSAINDLEEAISLKKDKETQLEVLQKLIDVTAAHFAYEEEIFRNTEYPLEEEHRTIHDDFVNEVILVQSAFESGKRELDQGVCDYVVNWLVNHIATEDKKYLQHFHEKNIH